MTASGIAREKHPRKKNTVENDNQTERQRENRGGIKLTEGNGQGSKRNQVEEMKENIPSFETNMIFGSRGTFCIAYGIVFESVI